MIENRTLEENAALCRSLGLQSIELNMNFPEYQTDCLERTDDLVREYGRILEAVRSPKP